MSGSARTITEDGRAVATPPDDDFGLNRIHVPQDVATIPPTGAQGISSGGTGDMMDQIVFAARPKYPRRDSEIFARIKAAAMSAGNSFYWSWPVKEKVRNSSGGFEYVEKIIEGPSIKAAEAVVQAYQNCKCTVRVEEYANHWIFTGVFIDGENGVIAERPYRLQKPSAPPGRMDAQRWNDMQFGSGCSKAIRNVVVGALSRYCQYAMQEAKGAIVGRIAENMDGARNYLIARAQAFEVPKRLVEGVIGRTLDKASAADMARLYALFQAVEDGQIELDEAFPNVIPETGAAGAAKMADDAVKPKPTAEKAAQAESADKPAPRQRRQAAAQEPNAPVATSDAGDRPASVGEDQHAAPNAPAAPSDPAPAMASSAGETAGPAEVANTAPPPASAPPQALPEDEELPGPAGGTDQGGLTFG